MLSGYLGCRWGREASIERPPDQLAAILVDKHALLMQFFNPRRHAVAVDARFAAVEKLIMMKPVKN
jgi:hypothetical protein